MAKVMHDKVREFKQKAAPITYSSINITQQGKLNDSLLDKGIVEGYSIIWGMKSLTGLKFLKGCCSRSIKEHGPGSNANYELKFLNQHNTDDPLSLYESLVEDDIGLRFRTKPLDLWDMEGSSAHRVITQLRSRTLNNFSHGFDWVWDKTEYDDSDDSLVCAEIQLFENSVVTIPAGLNTRRIQSLEEISDMNDEISDFIKIIPSKFRMQARQLFTLQNSLINLDSFEQQKKTIQEKQSKQKSIDYSYLNKNF